MLYSVESSRTRYDSYMVFSIFRKKKKKLSPCLGFCSFNLHIFMFYFVVKKDIATRVIAKEINIENTPVSKVMTRNPVFVLSETLAAEALQKMVQGL